MGKRSPNFARIPQDKYLTTDPGPVMRLQPYLSRCVRYAEPCAGRGDLIASMTFYGHVCTYANDIKPQKKWIDRRDALTLNKRWRQSAKADLFITNPPWLREMLHPLIDHLSGLLPTWLLLDADYAHTKQAMPYLEYCRQIVSVGRVTWFQGSANGGVDNAAWYLFDRTHAGGPRFAGLS